MPKRIHMRLKSLLSMNLNKLEIHLSNKCTRSFQYKKLKVKQAQRINQRDTSNLKLLHKSGLCRKVMGIAPLRIKNKIPILQTSCRVNQCHEEKLKIAGKNL